MKTIHKHGIDEEYLGIDLNLNPATKAAVFLLEIREREYVKENCPLLIEFLTKFADRKILSTLDLEEMYCLRTLLNQALRIKHIKLASFIYGFIVRDEYVESKEDI